MNKNYALTYVQVGGQLYKPGNLLPDTLTDKEWRRLMQKKAIRTVHDPVAAVADDMEEASAGESKEEMTGTGTQGQEAEKAPAEPAKAEKPANPEASAKGAGNKGGKKAAKQEAEKAAPPAGADALIK